MCRSIIMYIYIIIYGHSISTTAAYVSLINMYVQNRHIHKHTHTPHNKLPDQNQKPYPFGCMYCFRYSVYYVHVLFIRFMFFWALRLSCRVVENLLPTWPHTKWTARAAATFWLQPCHRCRRHSLRQCERWEMRVAAATQCDNDSIDGFVYQLVYLWLSQCGWARKAWPMGNFYIGKRTKGCSSRIAATRHHQQPASADGRVEHMAMIECCTQFPLAFQSPSNHHFQCADRERQRERATLTRLRHLIGGCHSKT